MLTVATFQTIAAALSACTALVGFLIALRNLPRLTNWLRSREALIADRNAAVARERNMTAHAEDARQAVADVRQSLEAVRATNIELSARLANLEKMRPIYDAALIFVPQALDHMMWLETMARAKGIDISGRTMPVIPAVFADYLTRMKSGDAS